METVDRVRIGEVASKFGISSKTIRHYEKVGILEAPVRNKMMPRTYSRKDIEKLRFILRLKNIGISLGEIREIVTKDTLFKPDDATSMSDNNYYSTSIIEKIDSRIEMMASLRNELVRYRQNFVGL